MNSYFTLAVLAGAAAAQTMPHYDATTRTLVVSVDGQPRFHYIFGKGGAVAGIYDLSLLPDTNIIAPSF